jgi:hypothetical protein
MLIFNNFCILTAIIAYMLQTNGCILKPCSHFRNVVSLRTIGIFHNGIWNLLMILKLALQHAHIQHHLLRNLETKIGVCL